MDTGHIHNKQDHTDEERSSMINMETDNQYPAYGPSLDS